MAINTYECQDNSREQHGLSDGHLVPLPQVVLLAAAATEAVKAAAKAAAKRTIVA
jgi:hypothetical protein